MSTGATPTRTEMDYWANGTIPWLKSGEVHNCCIFEVGERITEKALNSTSVKMQKGGTVVIAMYGATAAQDGFLCIDATTNQAICSLECSSFEKSAYLYFSLILSQREIFNQANGGAQDNLSKEMIEKFKIIKLPDDVIQTMGLPTLLNTIKYNTCELSKMKRLSELVVGKL
jgi:type I restriction enzyme S subunit